MQKPKRTVLARALRLAGAAGLLVTAERAFAAGAPVFPAGMETAIANAVGQIILVLNLMTWVLFVFLNNLLDPAFIFSFGGTLMDVLNQIWQLSRDLMNLVFAVVLVGAAVYTIIKGKKEFLSQYGPKFIMAVILVNFSWFLPRVVIDVANVGAAAVYGIPSLLGNNNAAASCASVRSGPPVPPAQLNGQPYCREIGANQYRCACTVVTDAQFFLEGAEEARLRGNGYSCPFGTLFCYKQEILNQATTAGYSAVLNGLVINHSRLAQLAVVPTPPPGGDLSRTIMFLVREVLVLVIHIALFFPLLAMTVAFFIRIPVLWLSIAFMPFYFLDFLLGNEQWTKGVGKKILDNFLKAAFLPLLVAVPLSAGLLLLNAGTVVQGGPLDQIPIRLFDQMNNFWQLLWMCMSLAVIWVGTFAVLKGQDIMSTGVQSIQNYGSQLGKFALKAPLALPVIPGTDGGGGPGMTPLGLMRRLHPSTLNAAADSGTPMRDVLDSLRGVTRPSETERKSARQIRENTLTHDQLRTLANNAGTDQRQMQQLIRVLSGQERTRGGITINMGSATHVQENIRTILDNIQRSGTSLNLSAAELDRIRAQAQALPRTAPTTPPATGGTTGAAGAAGGAAATPTTT